MMYIFISHHHLFNCVYMQCFYKTFLSEIRAIHTSIGLGGHSRWKGVRGCAAVMTPFFRASHSSLAHQFTVNVPLLCPLFSIFRKFLLFQPCFGQNSSSLNPNFPKFSFPRPPFFKENPLPRPYILKPAWHTPTKKKLSAPPRALRCCAVLAAQ